MQGCCLLILSVYTRAAGVVVHNLCTAKVISYVYNCTVYEETLSFLKKFFQLFWCLHEHNMYIKHTAMNLVCCYM